MFSVMCVCSQEGVTPLGPPHSLNSYTSWNRHRRGARLVGLPTEGHSCILPLATKLFFVYLLAVKKRSLYLDYLIKVVKQTLKAHSHRAIANIESDLSCKKKEAFVSFEIRTRLVSISVDEPQETDLCAHASSLKHAHIRFSVLCKYL